MSAVKIKKHVNLSAPLLPELVACLLTHFFFFFFMFAYDVQRREKSHQTHRFLKLLHVYKGREGVDGNQREYQSLEKYGNTSVRK